MFKSLLAIIFLFFGVIVKAQSKETIQWITFEQLEDSLAVNQENQKKIFISFFTDWCTYCKKMDKVVFTNPEVIDLINRNYYAIKFNAESEKTIKFDGQHFVNDQLNKTRVPLHQLAQLLALRTHRFSPPTMIVLNANFTVKSRYFQYLSSEELISALNFN